MGRTTKSNVLGEEIHLGPGYFLKGIGPQTGLLTKPLRRPGNEAFKLPAQPTIATGTGTTRLNFTDLTALKTSLILNGRRISPSRTKRGQRCLHEEGGTPHLDRAIIGVASVLGSVEKGGSVRMMWVVTGPQSRSFPS
ncbi:hypothetical protein AJ78_08737 [Emergomyces pasteurianus Ep9510]|uniref:Uncharacterized protein n=1 Tax=Emergomyces pasteurianus Ep9510 TaxID=1447872 RepID=A0A1J9P1B0_9EURO|nr:hypothetical protein AJ78_08737 [Emergomyces pasteurianus Ep9510]